MNRSDRFISICAHPDLRAELTPFGAGIFQLYFKGKEMLTTGPVELYFQPNGAFYGQTVAPVAGRIPYGRVGSFHFPMNEGPNFLHSGAFTTAFKDFESEVREKEDRIEVVFAHSQKVDEVDLLTKTTYVFFREAPRFSIEISATSSSLFPLNPTNHAYWTLGAKKLKDIELCFDARERVEYGLYKQQIGYRPHPEEFDGNRLLLNKSLDYAYHLAKPELTARAGNTLLKVKTKARAVVVYTGLKAPTPSFTLEFVDFPLCGEEMLRKGTSTIYAEYEMEEL